MSHSYFRGRAQPKETGSAKQHSKESILNVILPCLILFVSNLIFLSYLILCFSNLIPSNLG